MNNQARGELVPGGLAMVYGLKVDVAENGKLGELVRLCAAGEYFVSPSSGLLCEAVDGGWLVLGNFSHPYDRDEFGYSTFDACNLMPINPSADPLEITKQHEVEA